MTKTGPVPLRTLSHVVITQTTHKHPANLKSLLKMTTFHFRGGEGGGGQSGTFAILG